MEEHSYYNHLSQSVVLDDSADHLLNKAAGIRAITGITSALSVLGSSLIILSYFCFRDLRTAARLILVHLSITDLGVGLANFIGDVVNFDQYYRNLFNATNPQGPSPTVDSLCKTQAFFAEYFTLSSVLWTICLAVHMHTLIISRSKSYLKRVTRFFYPLCYLLPLLVSVWMLCTGRLGYAPYDSAGWCSIISIHPQFNTVLKSPESAVDMFSDLFGYYIWIYTTVFLITVLYASVFCYVRIELRESKLDQGLSINSKGFWQAMDNIDYKFILIPVMFIFLRIWSILIHVIVLYAGHPLGSIPSWIMLLLVCLSGFGDSGQGLINAIFFVIFSRNVRENLKLLFCRSSCCRKQSTKETRSLLLGGNQSTDPFLQYNRYDSVTLSRSEDRLSLSSSVSDFSHNK